MARDPTVSGKAENAAGMDADTFGFDVDAYVPTGPTTFVTWWRARGLRG